MLEALRTFEEEELLIFLNSDSKPIVLKSVKDESLIQLILPIKTYKKWEKISLFIFLCIIRHFSTNFDKPPVL